ncbi:MAG: type VI secretion system membrane subunit TssM [Oceanospirillaceae bacterium]|nr:type VI secretion system membrane subunit TssM [Oceanospirillaceae bacterium]
MFKKLFGIFKNRWFTSLLGLLAVAILVWFVGPMIAIAGEVPLRSEIVRLAVILVIVVLWGLNNMRIQMKVNKANSDLVSGFDQPVAAQDPTQAQSSEEVAQLKERFDEALQVMKKTSGKKGAAGIYDLPWYIIIGPPGSGKTTALLNSGLNFPLADRFGSASLQGVAGTRNCDWWFSEEAVLLDTAGRYTTQDSHKEVDSAAWVGFLKLLKKHRSRRPINGAIVAISLADIFTQNEVQREQHLVAIKKRLQELDEHLGVQFPIYMMLTKCDLIAGFNEFFEDLSQEDRRQVWGVSFPFDPSAEYKNPIDSFMQEFDALLLRLNDRLLWRMQQERDPQRRALLFSFPQQMASMRDLLKNFLGSLFSDSRYDKSLLVRGVYFTSGTQQGAPIDRVMGSLSQTFGLSPQMLRPYEGQGRSYFVNKLMQQVIFNEAGLVGKNHRVEFKRQWLQHVTYGAVLTVTAVAILAWMTSLTRNEVYIYEFKDALAKYQGLNLSNNVAIDDYDLLLDRLNEVRALSRVYEPFAEGVPLLMGMGLYQGDKLTSAAQTLYQSELNRLLLPSIKHRLEQHLIGVDAGPDLKYEALKAYLMLGDKDKLDEEFLTLWMSFDWESVYPQNPEIQGQFQQHMAQMLALGIGEQQLDENIVASARLTLKSVPLSELLYGRVKRDYQAVDQTPFKLIDAMGPLGEKVFYRESGAPLDEGISSLFTKAGYHDFFKDKMNTVSRISSEENWVLDPKKEALSGPEVKQLKQQMQQRYFSDYNQNWDALLSDLRIKRFKNLSQATDILDTLASPNSPMKNLLQTTVINTSLFEEGLLDKAVGKVTGKDNKGRLSRLLLSATGGGSTVVVQHPEQQVDEHFALINGYIKKSEAGGAPIDQLYSLFAQLFGQFETMSVGIGADSLSAATEGVAGDLLTRMQSETTRMPEPVKSWMQQIMQNSRSVTMSGARGQINQIWQAEILPLCKKAIQNRYPFFKKSGRDIALLDFGKLFAPGGLIDAFFEDNVKPFVRVSANGRWSWKPIGNSYIGMSNNTLVQFKRAAGIRDAYFQLGGASPSVSFGLKPIFLDRDVKSFSLNLEGQQFRYRHGPARTHNARWPAPNSNNQLRVVFISNKNSKAASTIEGAWALFRLLDRSKIKVKSSNEVEATFSLKGFKSTWRLKANTVSNPFQTAQMHNFRCPNRL